MKKIGRHGIFVQETEAKKLGDNGLKGDQQISIMLAPEYDGDDTYVYAETNGDPVILGWIDNGEFICTEDEETIVWMAEEAWMAEFIVAAAKIGSNGYLELREELREDLDRVVRKHFNTLYEGAVRLGVGIEEDNYAPKRVQINNTRLHEQRGLKYAAGHKYSDGMAPTEEQLMQAMKDIETLFFAAAETCPLRSK